MYTTVQAAVNAASSGATIYVCAGTYNESLTISKPLTILGAEYNVAAGAGDTSARTNATNESTLKGDVSYQTGASSGTLTGFTLVGTATDVPVVKAKQVGSGWQFTNDIVDVSNGGFQFDTDNQATPPTSNVGDDRFVQATPNATGGGWYGQAVTFSSVANDVTIADNAFDYLTGPGAAINTTPFSASTACSSISSPPTSTQAGDFNNNLSVTGNTLVQDDSPTHVGTPGTGNEDNFIALFCTTSARVTGNTITTTSAHDGDANSGLYLGGGDWTTTISSNHLVGDGAPNASGITDSTDFYPASAGIFIKSNTVSGYLYGIHLRGSQTGFDIRSNSVSGSLTAGISITGSTATGGTVVSNTVSGTTAGAGHYDCVDHTTGAGTAGTANTWTHDIGSTSSPSGLCSPVSVPPAPGGVSEVVSTTGAIDTYCGSGLGSLPVFTTIQAAVNAASSGATIYVCAGTYNESLTISKPLTILGAEYSVAAGAGDTSARTSSTNESTLKGDVSYQTGSSSGTLTGFTLVGTATDVPVVKAKQVGSGWQFTNDIVDVSNGGFQFDTDNQASPPTSNVSGDRFVQATPNATGGGWYGQAVTFSSVANDVTISNDAFDYLTGPGAAINTTPFSASTACSSISSPPTPTQAGDFNNNLSVTGNTLVQDDSPSHVGTPGTGNEDNFIALFCSTYAQITHNTITTTSAHDGDANSGLYLGGGDWTTTISSNHLVGDGATNASGITDSTDFYPASAGIFIKSNTVSGYLYGIHLRGSQTGFDIRSNSVSGSLTDGIAITGSTATGGTVVSNTVSGTTAGAGHYDCVDHTTGGGTAGTANTWTHDIGSTSSPSGLCAQPAVTTLSPAAGPTSGGTTVHLAGVNLAGATAVTFGSTTAASFSVTASATTITAVTKPHGPATVTVVVVTPNGTTAPKHYTFDPAPTLSSLTPTAGPLTAGTPVTLTGSGFVTGATVAFGTAAGTTVTVVSSTKVIVKPPAHTPAAVAVTVTTPGGTSGAKAYSFDPIPALSSVTPTAGPVTAGTPVTLTGSGFVAGATVAFGVGHAGTTVHVVSTSSITVKAPTHSAGTVTVTVTTPGGTSGGKSYTFDAGPTLTTVTPPAGPLTAGTSVTLTGTGFVTGATVAFGVGNPGTTVHVVSGSSITVKAPAHAVGTVTVTVTTPGGTTGAKHYSYEPVPTISSMSRTSGPTSGGTSVNITGTGFSTTKSVKFGTTSASSFTVRSATQVTAIAPPHALGPVRVSVTTPGGTSPTVSADSYTFTSAAPTVTSISPSSGSVGGGTTVTVTGTNFVSGATVTFGTAAGTTVVVVSSNQITVKSPSGTAGTIVDVKVTTSGGSSAVVSGDKFTFGAIITSISRTTGPVAGGTKLTITGSGFSSVTKVQFASTTSASFTVKSSTQISVTSPAHSSGQVRISVITHSGTTPATNADLYTYH